MADMLSQDEINQLLGSNNVTDISSIKDMYNDVILKSTETLGNLIGVNAKCEYKEVVEFNDLSNELEKTNGVLVNVKYKNGINGNVFVYLNANVTKKIAGLMVGNEDGAEEITDLHISAVSEAMSQMFGSSCTGLSESLDATVEIDVPKVILIKSFDEIKSSEEVDLKDNEKGLKYDLILGDDFKDNIYIYLNSALVISMGTLSDIKKNVSNEVTQDIHTNENKDVMASKVGSMVNNQSKPDAVNKNVDVKAVRFDNITSSVGPHQKENIDLIMDVPLEVTVELGRTHKSIKEILEFAPGTILELDKLAGEPIDILVNGKFVAKGEVIVIDENFGIRITEIIEANQRI